MRHLFPAILLGAATLNAQTPASRTLDRGTFVITVNGQRVGREDFSIGGTPGARSMEYLSTSTTTMSDRRRENSLWSDSAGAPLRYSIRIRGTSGTTIESWVGDISRGRVSARVTNTRGGSEREYVVSEGAVILEEDVFHQYFFVVQRATGPSVRVVVPLRNRQLQLTVTPSGSESLTIGGKSIEGRKLTFAEANGATREVWVDAGGKVLKVAIPARGLDALRDEPPAT